eukprot:TRINITY_DN12166_c0_g1_i2.p1 TRINITY_DN12166_c0_g1~~TRINITY_DN12166_c0_g1_i2.p1  ORF type:complete len:1127 (+),score=350.68 TRINITY_DN12166_c0_g1_i2:232-3381(+)
MDALLAQCSDQHKDVLQQIYKLDTNHDPAAYTLAVKVTINKAEREQVLALLQQAAVIVKEHAPELMQDSITLAEVKASLQATDDPTRSVVALEREFVMEEATSDLARELNDAEAWGLPLDCSGEDDPLNQITKLLEDAGVETVHYKLKYDEPRPGVKSDGPALLESSIFVDYATEAMVQAIRLLLRTVSRGIDKFPAIVLPAWSQEVLVHGKTAMKLAAETTPQPELSAVLDAYVKSKDSKSMLVVVGEERLEASHALAHWVTPHLAAEHDTALWMCRFLGTTRASASVSQTLRLLLQQVAFSRDPAFVEEVPKLVNQLFTTFVPLLWQAAKLHGKVVLVLDGLDEYCDEPEKREESLGLFAWLTTTLPPNVKIIVSATLAGPALEQLKAKLDDSNFVMVPRLTFDEAMQRLDHHLAANSMNITDAQGEVVSAAFGASDLSASYVRDVLEAVEEWRSFDVVLELPTSSIGLFEQRLVEVELKHSQLLVGTLFKYLASSRKGLTMPELMAVLGRDEVFTTEFYQFVEYPSGSFPMHVLARVKQAFGHYLETDLEGAWHWSDSKYGAYMAAKYPATPESQMHLAVVLKELVLEALDTDIPMVKSTYWGLDSITDSQAFLDMAATAQNAAWLFAKLDAKDQLSNMFYNWQILHSLLAQDEFSDSFSRYFKISGLDVKEFVEKYTVILRDLEWSHELADFVWTDLARFAQAQYVAEPLLEPLGVALEWLKAHLGTHSSTAACINMMGRSYLLMRNSEAASDKFAASLDILRRLEEPDLRLQAAVLNNQAIAYKRMHRFETAYETLQEAVRIHIERNPGPANVQLAGVYSTLGLNSQYIGRLGEGLAYLRQAYDVFLRFEGETLRSFRNAYNLALLYLRNKDYTEALSLSTAAYDSLVETKDATYELALKAATVKAQCLTHLNRDDEARAILEDVIAIREQQTKGIEMLMHVRCVRGELLVKQGYLDEAQEEYNAIVASLAKVAKPDVEDRTQHMKLGARIAAARGDKADAIRQLEERRTILRETMPSRAWIVTDNDERLKKVEEMVQQSQSDA